MYQRGTRSWRFEHGDDQFLHIALFVRDAARLAVTAAGDVPPRLAADVPDRAELVPPGDRETAAGQWLIWWRRLVAQVAREASQHDAAARIQDPMARLEAMFAGRDEVFDAPGFASLAGLEPLRSAAAAGYDDAVRWTSGPDRGARPHREWFAWPLVRDVAESTAAELGVPVGELAAVARVLEVAGSWSYLAAPGCALCSAAVADDPSAGRLLLHELFASGRAGTAAS